MRLHERQYGTLATSGGGGIPEDAVEDARFSVYRPSNVSVRTQDAHLLQASPTHDSRREHYDALGEFRSEYLDRKLRTNNSAAVATWQPRVPREGGLDPLLGNSLEGHRLKGLRLRDLPNPLLTASQESGVRDSQLLPPGEADAYRRFQQRGGFFDDESQHERRVLCIERNGILRYESRPRSPDKTQQSTGTHARSPEAVTVAGPGQRGADKADFWDSFKEKVLHDLRHGTVSNKRKPKAEVVAEAAPDVDCLLHTKVHSVYQLLGAFRPEKRAEVVSALLAFTVSKDTGSFLVSEIARIAALMERGQDDDFDRHMILVYKFLFKKRVEATATKARVAGFDEGLKQEHNDRFMRKVYDGHVASFRRRMFALMLQEEALLDDAASLATEAEESGEEAPELSTSLLRTEEQTGS